MFARRRQAAQRKKVEATTKTNHLKSSLYMAARNGVQAPTARSPHRNRMHHFCEPLNDVAPRITQHGAQG